MKYEVPSDGGSPVLTVKPDVLIKVSCLVESLDLEIVVVRI